MFLGEFSAALFPIIAFTSGTLAIIICYYISQYLHHEKPFPDTWISATADHYPEFIFFRIGTITGAVFLVLSHVMSYFWVCQTARDHAFNISKYRPGIGTIMGMTGSMFLMGSTATLDTGKHNTNWHVFCAGNFFVWNIFSVWYYTYVSYILYSKVKAGGKVSLIIKVVLSFLIVIQVYLDTKAHGLTIMHRLHSHLSNILEYTLAFSLLGFFLINAYDLRSYKLAYV